MEWIVVLFMLGFPFIVIGLPVGGVLLGFYSGSYANGRADALEGRRCHAKTLKHPDFMARAEIRGYNSVKKENQ